MPLKWSARRGEESGILATNELVASTNYEGTKELDSSSPDNTPHNCELCDTEKAVQCVDAFKICSRIV